MKQFYIDRVTSHMVAGTLMWRVGCGCAIGCTVHKYYHADFETFGVPEWLAWANDVYFENVRDWRTWPLRFLAAIPIGIDLSNFKPNIVKLNKDKISLSGCRGEFGVALHVTGRYDMVSEHLLELLRNEKVLVSTTD